jgi:hypothetical protein
MTAAGLPRKKRLRKTVIARGIFSVQKVPKTSRNAAPPPGSIADPIGLVRDESSIEPQVVDDLHAAADEKRRRRQALSIGAGCLVV